jgi:hypothetical protein
MKLPVKLLLLASSCVCVTAPAYAKTEIHPYLEVDQVVDAPLRGGGEVLTYTSIGGGIEATVEGQRTQVEVSYRYERRIGWGKNLDTTDSHSGLVRAAYQIVPNALSIEAGALATRGRSDIRGAAPQPFGNNNDNISQVYQVYAGPTLQTQLGQLDVAASYQASYTAATGSNFTPAVGQPRLDAYDHSISHTASASVGMAPGTALPVGWNVAGYYGRENAGQLSQRFETAGVRGELVYPVTESIAVVGGVGYEKLKDSQRGALLDASGNPVVNAKGRFVTDPASPRTLGYNFDGIYWDVGVQWKPSRRTSMEVAIGRRYGTMSYTGSVSWAPSEHSALQLGIYDQVETFGGQLNRGTRGIPSNFNRNGTGRGQQFGGCTFGSGGEAGAQGGGCLSSTLGSIATGRFRSRGASLQWAAESGRMSYGLGTGYSQRKFLAGNIPGTFTINGQTDEEFFVQGDLGYALDSRSSLDLSAYGNYFNPGIVGAANVVSAGATGSYQREFGRHLSAHAALGLYSFQVDGDTGNLNMNAQVGVRYSF